MIVAIKIYISAGVGTPNFSPSQFSLFLKVCASFLELTFLLLLKLNLAIVDLGLYYFVTVSAQLCQTQYYFLVPSALF